jgi:hypothetical protein
VGGRSAPDQGRQRWLLLVHQIPPKPDYFRVKVRRRLQRLGAVALKSTVYVLPWTDDTLEDFQWLRSEIAGEGGEAIVCEARFVEGVTDVELERVFRRARDADYAAISTDALALRARTGKRKLSDAERTEVESAVIRLRRRLHETIELDFFQANGRAAADAAVTSLADRLTTRAARAASAQRQPDHVAPGGTWVTRRDVFVDRIASAWLIGAFIDPAARFKFVSAAGPRPAPGELRYDMFEAEYTHVGDHCTFETLIERFGLGSDTALRAIAEIVHDIDLKDAKFARAEASGIEQLLAGIARRTTDDADRLTKGAPLFSALYESFADTASACRTSTRGHTAATSRARVPKR